jgi:hypothetical protein
MNATFLFIDLGVGLDGTIHREMREHSRITSAAHFGPVINGILLFRWLFPGSGFASDVPEEIVKIPGYSFLHDSQELAYRTYEEIAYLVDGLLDVAVPAPLFHGGAPYRAQTNDQSLSELRAAQGLLSQAMGAPDDFGDYRRLDHGLAAIDMGVEHEIDTILRRDVHERLIWLGDFEEADHENESSVISMADMIVFDRGVFPAIVPESLVGLVAFDFAESLRLDRAAGRCERCHQPLLLTAQQSARARRGLPVFHRSCHAEHRLAYFRQYQQGRGF